MNVLGLVCTLIGMRVFQIEAAVDSLVTVHVSNKGLIGFVEQSTLASVMLSKTMMLADRQRVVRRLLVRCFVSLLFLASLDSIVARLAGFMYCHWQRRSGDRVGICWYCS
jgi:hypothetical protein